MADPTQPASPAPIQPPDKPLTPANNNNDEKSSTYAMLMQLGLKGVMSAISDMKKHLAKRKEEAKKAIDGQ